MSSLWGQVIKNALTILITRNLPNVILRYFNIDGARRYARPAEALLQRDRSASRMLRSTILISGLARSNDPISTIFALNLV